jgi:hypothetical protein
MNIYKLLFTNFVQKRGRSLRIHSSGDSLMGRNTNLKIVAKSFRYTINKFLLSNW